MRLHQVEQVLDELRRREQAHLEYSQYSIDIGSASTVYLIQLFRLQIVSVVHRVHEGGEHLDNSVVHLCISIVIIITFEKNNNRIKRKQKQPRATSIAACALQDCRASRGY